MSTYDNRKRISLEEVYMATNKIYKNSMKTGIFFDTKPGNMKYMSSIHQYPRNEQTDEKNARFKTTTCTK